MRLASQPTLSRFENAVSPRALYRVGEALTDTVMARHRRRARGERRVTIDIDVTEDPTHGAQQLTFVLAVGRAEALPYCSPHRLERTRGWRRRGRVAVTPFANTEKGSTPRSRGLSHEVSRYARPRAAVQHTGNVA